MYLAAETDFIFRPVRLAERGNELLDRRARHEGCTGTVGMAALVATDQRTPFGTIFPPLIHSRIRGCAVQNFRAARLIVKYSTPSSTNRCAASQNLCSRINNLGHVGRVQQLIWVTCWIRFCSHIPHRPSVAPSVAIPVLPLRRLVFTSPCWLAYPRLQFFSSPDLQSIP